MFRVYIPHGKIVYYMKIVIVWGVSLFFCLLYVKIFAPTNLSGNGNDPLAFQIGKELTIYAGEVYKRPVCHILSVIVAIIYGLYLRNKTQVIFYKNRNEISKFVIFLDYYSLLLPNFLFFGSLVIFCVPVFLIGNFFNTNQLITYLNNLLAAFCVLLMYPIYPLIFISLFLLKREYDHKTNITLKMANDIFTNYLIKNNDSRENDIYIKKFCFYLNKSIKSVDNHWTKGVRIEDIEHNEKNSIKKVIAGNLYIYLRYGTQAEIDSLKYNLNHILNLVINETKKIL